MPQLPLESWATSVADTPQCDEYLKATTQIPMNIITSDDVIGILPNHPRSAQFTVIGYQDGSFSCIGVVC